MRKSVFLVMLTLLLATQLCYAQKNAERVTVEQIVVPKVTLMDPELITFFVNEFFIPESLVTKIDIIDATSNGFGKNDLALTHPSGEIYFIYPSEKAQNIMNNWKFTPNFQIVGENLDPEVYESLPTDRAANNIFSALLKGLQRNYRGNNIKIRFERDGASTTFEMWGFREEDLQYTPAPVPGGRDLVYIYTTIKDTVYVEK